jgi:nitroimidazol reductase NimA-like FMN-containing flavoprotein (pyridoxamine 5'-phosphate oxidase superfamily)
MTGFAHPEEMIRPGDLSSQASEILASHSIMSIATVRPDGWPQSTIVGYANDGLTIYFLVMRSSQKLANIEADNRISLTIGDEPSDISQATAVYCGAHAIEVADEVEREFGWRLLSQRHPNLENFALPDRGQVAMMRATCKYVSVVDYSKGLGHVDHFSWTPSE